MIYSPPHSFWEKLQYYEQMVPTNTLTHLGQLEYDSSGCDYNTCKRNANTLGSLKPQVLQHADFSGAAVDPLAGSGLVILMV